MSDSKKTDNDTVLLYKDIKDLAGDRDRTLSFADRIELVREFDDWFVQVGAKLWFEDANGNWQAWDDLPKPHQSRIQNVWMYHESLRGRLGLSKKAARMLESGSVDLEDAAEAGKRTSQEERLMDRLSAFKASKIELQGSDAVVSVVRQPIMFQGRTSEPMRRGYGAHRAGFQVVERGLYYGCTSMPVLAIWDDTIRDSAMTEAEQDEWDGRSLDPDFVVGKLDALAADSHYGRVFDWIRQNDLAVAADPKWINGDDGRVWYFPLIPAQAKRMGAFIGTWWWPTAPTTESED